MQPGFSIEVLAGGSEVVGEGAGAGWVGIGGIRAEGIGVQVHMGALSLGRVIWRGVFN